MALRLACSRKFATQFALSAALMVGIVCGVRVGPAPAEESGARVATQVDESGRLIYHCRVVERGTGKGIPNARVVVRRRTGETSQQQHIDEETRHVTDAEGNYTIEIPPEQVTARRLYLSVSVEHDQYATRAGIGYLWDTIRKNEQAGDRPFFERTELLLAGPVTGKVVSPDGKPLAGITVVGWSAANRNDSNDYFSFTTTSTSQEGAFRLNLAAEAEGIYWVLPKDFAITETYLGRQRGDVGEIRLQPGIRAAGGVVDAEGKPLPGAAVNIYPAGNDGTGGLPVGSLVRRGALSDEQGQFAFDPLPPGHYRVVTGEYDNDPTTNDPGVFLPMKVTLREGGEPPLIDVQPVPHVVLHAQFLDSTGKHTQGDTILVSGQLRGESWTTPAQPDRDGAIALKIPRGLERVLVQLIPSEHVSTRFRLSPEAPLKPGGARVLNFGTLNDDLNGLEIVYYRSPVVLISAVDEAQQPIKDFQVRLDGELHSKLSFKRQPDSRYRATQLLPDEDVTFTAMATGYEPTSETVRLPEGEIKELVLTLKRNRP